MNEDRRTTEGQVMGVMGIVLGIISLIVAFIPCVGIVAIIPGVVAVTFSLISISQANKGNGAKGLGIAALVVSVLSVIIAILWLLLISGGSIIANKAFKDNIHFNYYESTKGIEIHSDSDTVRQTHPNEHIERLRELEGKDSEAN